MASSVYWIGVIGRWESTEGALTDLEASNFRSITRRNKVYSQPNIVMGLQRFGEKPNHLSKHDITYQSATFTPKERC